MTQFVSGAIAEGDVTIFRLAKKGQPNLQSRLQTCQWVANARNEARELLLDCIVGLFLLSSENMALGLFEFALELEYVRLSVGEPNHQ